MPAGRPARRKYLSLRKLRQPIDEDCQVSEPLLVRRRHVEYGTWMRDCCLDGVDANGSFAGRGMHGRNYLEILIKISNLKSEPSPKETFSYYPLVRDPLNINFRYKNLENI